MNTTAKERFRPAELFFYAGRDEKNKKRLEAAVHQVIPAERTSVFGCLRDLEARLRLPVEAESIVVLLASDKRELQELQLLREWLTELYIILVIPDQKPDTIKLAHLLLPRFMSQKDDSFSDLKKVLRKIHRTHH